MHVPGTTDLIGENIHRLSIAPSPHFEFSQFLIVDEKTCLVHAGQQKLFPQLREMVVAILHERPLDYVVFSHVESDESGAVNHWLEAYGGAVVACNRIANINLSDFLARPPVILKEGETLPLGRHELQLIDTPHFPHNWDAHLWYDPSEQILFSSDFCCQPGVCPPLVDTDISDAIIDFYSKTGFMPYGPSTREALAKINGFPIRKIAPMHGSVIEGPVCDLVLQKVTADLAERA